MSDYGKMWHRRKLKIYVGKGNRMDVAGEISVEVMVNVSTEVLIQENEEFRK